MAVRPSTVIASIVAQIEATAPHTDTDAARPKNAQDVFRHYANDTTEHYNRNRGFVLELESGPAIPDDFPNCGWRTMGLRLAVTYVWAPLVFRRVADDADALETALNQLNQNVSTVQVSEVGEPVSDFDPDGNRVILEIPFAITYDREGS